MADQRPFKVTQAFPFKRDDGLKPATDMRPLKDQSKDQFLATSREKLYKFTRTRNMWTEKPSTTKMTEARVRGCLILPCGSVFVAKENSFYFFSKELELVSIVDVTTLAVFLNEISNFKPLTHSENGAFIMIAT